MSAIGEKPLEGLRVLAIGAHPDDCEEKLSGSAARWRAQGAYVKFVSATDGSGGHFEIPPSELRAIRKRECETCARVLDIDYEVLDNPDGHLEPTLERRLEFIRLIRRTRPDLVITHRLEDYHPDHRYTSVLVQDSAYMVTVPHVCPDTPHLDFNPVFAYAHDRFTRPAPFRADVCVIIDDVVETKWAAIRAHASQMFEWLPYNQGVLDRVPPASDPEARRRFLEDWGGPFIMVPAEEYRRELDARYGAERAATARFVEVFEISEYGRRPLPDEIDRFFPR